MPPKSEKPPTSFNLLEVESPHDPQQEDHCLPSLRLGVERFLAQAGTQQDNLPVKRQPLLRLLREHIDAPFTELMALTGIRPPGKFSELYRMSAPAFALDGWLHQQVRSLRQPHGDTPPFDWNMLVHSIDALREVAHVCLTARGSDILYLKVDDHGSVMRTKLPKAGKLPSTMPFYLLDTHPELCRLCYRPIAHVSAAANYKPDNNRIEQRRMLRQVGNELHHLKVTGYSQRFCKQHDPALNKTAYNKANARKLLFLSLIRYQTLLVRQLRQPRIDPDDELIRLYSYRMTHEYPGWASLNVIPQLLHDYYDSKDANHREWLLKQSLPLFADAHNWLMEQLSQEQPEQVSDPFLLFLELFL